MTDDGKLVLAVDPGAMTGVALWGHGGLVASFQDQQRAALVNLVTLYRVNRERVVAVGVERAFVGKGASASLSVAEAGGFTAGVLWAAGWVGDTWRPFPSEWRKAVGVEGKDRKANEKHARALATEVCMYERKFSVAQTHEAEAILMARALWQRWWGRQIVAQVAHVVDT